MSQVIINDVPPYTQITATGGQVDFGTNWTANYPSDVVVYQTPVGDQPNDNTQILDYPSDYSVSFVGGSQEVLVTLVSGATAGDIITITRMTPADRENLYSNTNFLPSMLNNDFGILTFVDQQAQLVNQLIAPRYNYSADITPLVDTILPILGPDQVWIKNSNNSGFIALTITGGQVGSGTVDTGAENEIAFYPANGNTVSGVATSDNAVLSTNSLGVPVLSSTLPNNLEASAMHLIVPVFSSPVLGTPISGTLTNCTGLPSGTGIICTDTNDNAESGQLGEFVSSVILSGSAITAPSNADSDLTSISLTAGDWDVWGNVAWITLGTTPNILLCWTSTTSMTQTDASLRNQLHVNSGIFLTDTSLIAPMLRYSLGSTTTIYLSSRLNNASGNGTQCGALYARRVR